MSARQQPSETAVLTYVIEALRHQERRYRSSHLTPPASIPDLVAALGFGVSRRQQTTPDASPAQAGDGGSETRLMVRYETAARMLEVSDRTLQRLVKRGSLPAVKVADNTSRIRVADLESYTAGLPTKTEAA